MAQPPTPSSPPAASRLAGLGPLMDGSALFGIATQLLAARRRLALRTGGAIPTVGELAVGLRMYMSHCDTGHETEREADADVTAEPLTSPGPSQAPPPGSPACADAPADSAGDVGRANKDASNSAGAPADPPVSPLPVEPSGTACSPLIASPTPPPAVATAASASGASQPLPPPLTDLGELAELRELLRLADLTYKSGEQLAAHASSAPVFSVLSARWKAEKWAPAYFLAWFPDTRELLLSVRGSKEISDVLTNLTVEAEPFLGGLAHRGVIESARRLHRILAPILDAHLAAQKVERVTLVGHSLGGAVATALLLLLRGGSDVSPEATENDPLRRARCIAFGPPPFLSRDLASRAASLDVTSIVFGLDAVPRLSAASLDRFLLAVARHDWAPQLGSTIERAACAFLNPTSAARVGDFLARRGGAGAAWAVSAFGTTARRALEASRSAGADARSPLWEGVLAASAVVSSVVGSQFLHGGDGGAGRRPDYPFARQFGMSGDDVERLLVDDAPPEMFLAGDILRFDVPFISAAQYAETGVVPVGKVRRATMDEFGDVDASIWMVYHHHPRVLLAQLDQMLGGDQVVDLTQDEE